MKNSDQLDENLGWDTYFLSYSPMYSGIPVFQTSEGKKNYSLKNE